MTALEWGMLVSLSVLWGCSFFFTGLAVRELPPFTVVVGRVGLAALILLIVMRLLREKVPTGLHIWGAFFGMGFLNNAVPFSLIVWGQSHIASGVASILNATTPLFTVIVAHWLTADEKMTGGRFLGVVVGLIGAAVMIGSEALRTIGVDIVAQLACLAAAGSYAFAGIFASFEFRVGRPHRRLRLISRHLLVRLGHLSAPALRNRFAAARSGCQEWPLSAATRRACS